MLYFPCGITDCKWKTAKIIFGLNIVTTGGKYLKGLRIPIMDFVLKNTAGYFSHAFQSMEQIFSLLKLQLRLQSSVTAPLVLQYVQSLKQYNDVCLFNYRVRRAFEIQWRRSINPIEEGYTKCELTENSSKTVATLYVIRPPFYTTDVIIISRRLICSWNNFVFVMLRSLQRTTSLSRNVCLLVLLGTWMAWPI